MLVSNPGSTGCENVCMSSRLYADCVSLYTVGVTIILVLKICLLYVWLPGRSPELFKCLRWVTIRNENQGLKPPSVKFCVTVVFL